MKFLYKLDCGFARILLPVLLFSGFAIRAQAQSLASVKLNTPDLQTNQISLKQALSEIEGKFKVVFGYESKLVENQMVEKGNWSRISNLEEAANQLLSPLKLTYEKVSKNVYVIRPAKANTIQFEKIDTRKKNTNGSQSISLPLYRLETLRAGINNSLLAVVVSGLVTDAATNQPLPGVNILVKGATQGTTTDSEGRYSISVADENAVLVFSFIGYMAEEVKVGNRTMIDVRLVPDIQTLSEVVVIGYGEKPRALLTESIGTVNTVDIQKLPVSSPDQAIQGRISGVQVTNVDGTPGSPVAIRIRGVGTTGNTQPLYVIDGIPVGNADALNTNPLTTINPADIESISVLKDASAAAVYGVRAANGVVLITTKRGKTGKPKVNFDGYYGVQRFPKLFDWNTTEQYVDLTREAIEARNTQFNLAPGNDGYQVLHPDLNANNPNNVLGINTDWQNATLNKNAPIQNYNLSVSGGSEASNYHVSVGYFNQEATVNKWDLDRFTFRANSDYKVGSRFRFGQTFSVAYQEVVRGMNAGGDGFYFAGTANMPPFFQIYEDPNNPIPGNRYGFNGNFNVAGLTVYNNIGLNELINANDRLIRLLGGVYGELEIINGLTFKSQASLDFNTNRNTSWQPGYTGRELGVGREINNFNEGRGEGYTQVFTNTLTFDRKFGDHALNVLTGIEYQKIRSNRLSATGQDFLSTDPAFYTIVSNQQGVIREVGGQTIRVPENPFAAASNDAWVGYIGRLSYGFRDKYLLTTTFRRDGAARFAPGLRYGNFPSVSAAWRVSEEPFFDALPFVSELKLRGSWGQLGNANTLSFPYIFRVSFTPDYGSGNTTLQAPTPANFPNRDISWETVETTDLGLDVTFFNKISLLATYYRRNTKDFLYSLPIPYLSGFNSTPVNAGNVLNTGVELELGYNTTFGNGLQLNLSGNLTTVKNRLTALSPGIEEFASGDYRTAVGHPIGYFYGYKTNGLYQTPAEAAEALPDEVAGGSDNNRPRPGDVRFVDTNGPALEDAPEGQQFSGVPDGRITPADRTYLGKTIPDFFYGFNIGANFKGFDLSVLFQGVSGVQVYNEYRRNSEALTGGGRNVFTSTQNRWTGPGTSNDMPRAIAGDPYQNNRFSDRWIENAGFLRLRNLQIGYSLPKNLLDRTKAFSQVRVYLAGSNLFRITKYTGLDPEVVTYGSNSNQLGAGTDAANIPQPRVIQGGFQLQF